MGTQGRLNAGAGIWRADSIRQKYSDQKAKSLKTIVHKNYERAGSNDVQNLENAVRTVRNVTTWEKLAREAEAGKHRIYTWPECAGESRGDRM